MNPYLKEAIDLHVLIEVLFFMVTPTGIRIGLQDVANLFAQRAGGPPGLTIELTELETLAQWSEGVVIRYHETHRMPGPEAKERISGALFTRQGACPLWRHLHETWAS